MFTVISDLKMKEIEIYIGDICFKAKLLDDKAPKRARKPCERAIF